MRFKRAEGPVTKKSTWPFKIFLNLQLLTLLTKHSPMGLLSSLVSSSAPWNYLSLSASFSSYITWSNEKCYPSLKNPTPHTFLGTMFAIVLFLEHRWCIFLWNSFILWNEQTSRLQACNICQSKSVLYWLAVAGHQSQLMSTLPPDWMKETPSSFDSGKHLNKCLSSFPVLGSSAHMFNFKYIC